jgi:mutator protein MutT
MASEERKEVVEDQNLVEVAAGLVFQNGRLLIAQRRADDHLGGLWEFPGGKRAPGETFEACLHRELKEELGIEVEVEELLARVTHRYPEKVVHLKFYRCRLREREPHAIGCQALAWVTPHELSRYSFPEADSSLVKKLEKTPELWR